MTSPRPVGGDIVQGSIIWAPIPDHRGIRKVRPGVVVTSNSEIPDADLIAIVAITTTFADPPPPNLVTLPWNAQGTTTTALRRRSAVVCDWVANVSKSALRATPGAVPPQVLIEVIHKMRECRRGKDESDHVP